MKTSKKLLLPATYTLFMSIGITFVLMQIYSGSFAESFSLNMTELGTLLSCQFIASIIAPLISGRLSDVIGKKKVLIAGIAIYSVGCFIMGFSKSVFVCQVGIFLMGGGNSCANGVFCAALVDAFPEKASRYIALTSVVASGMNMVTSLLSSLLGDVFPDWRMMFIAAGVIILLPLCFTSFAKIERANKEIKAAQGMREFITALKNPGLILACIATAFACAMCMTYASYVDGYYTDILGAEKLGASMVFIHSLCSFLSNSIFGLMKMREETKIKIFMFGGASFLILEVLMTNVTLAFIFGLLFSFLQATAFSMCISLAAKQDPANSGTATSLALVANGAGSTLGSIGAGFMADIWDMRGGYLLLAVCGLISGLTVVILDRMNKKRQKAN